jgi:hypothetical protein
MIISSLFVITETYDVWMISSFQASYLILQIFFTTLTFNNHLANLLARINPTIGGVGALNFRYYAILASPDFLLVYITHFI